MKMASLTKEDIRSVIETIKELYLEDMIPWICGYSGGKDCSACVVCSPGVAPGKAQKNRSCY